MCKVSSNPKRVLRKLFRYQTLGKYSLRSNSKSEILTSDHIHINVKLELKY